MKRALRLLEFGVLYFGTPLALLWVPVVAERRFHVRLNAWVIPALLLPVLMFCVAFLLQPALLLYTRSVMASAAAEVARAAATAPPGTGASAYQAMARRRLAAVPEVVKEWPALEDLLLDHNPIGTLPDWGAQMPRLRSVSLAGCKIAKLPDDLSGWRKLDSLVLSGCPIPADEMKRIRRALGDDVAVVF